MAKADGTGLMEVNMAIKEASITFRLSAEQLALIQSAMHRSGLTNKSQYVLNVLLIDAKKGEGRLSVQNMRVLEKLENDLKRFMGLIQTNMLLADNGYTSDLEAKDASLKAEITSLLKWAREKLKDL